MFMPVCVILLHLSYSRALRGSVAKHVESCQLSENRFYDLPKLSCPRVFGFNLPQLDAQVMVGKYVYHSKRLMEGSRTHCQLSVIYYHWDRRRKNQDTSEMRIQCATSLTHSNH
ncbi:hypothetical protein EDD17DRAFT_172464 [Pisolithus thermaeus]|nr:hypothetical protein EDD17DRAFT_172464 [Pisolithus thermaeus]